MYEHSSRKENQELTELLKQYELLLSGRQPAFLEEESFEKIINYFDENDEFPRALEAAENGLLYFPYSILLLLKKADLLIAMNQYHEALDVLNHQALFSSYNINVYILKTDALLALDEQETAIDLLLEAIHVFEGEEKIELLFELSDVYDDYELFDKVFDCLQLVLEQEPSNEEALYKICFWTDFTGRNEESIRIHRDIIEDQPYNELAWFNLGTAYQGLKLYEKAIDAYLYAIAIDEKFDSAYRNLGDAYMRIRNFREAIQSLEKMLELSRPEEVIYEAIGHCYHKLKNFAQARFNYRKASHINPENHKLFYKIALTYIHEKNWQQAMKPLETALRMFPSSMVYHMALGECFLAMGKNKDAIHYFSIVVHKSPRKVSGWESLIHCLYQSGFLDEAKDQCLVALAATGQKASIYYLYSAVLFASGKPKMALQQLETAIILSPKGLRKFIDLNPVILQNAQVVALLAQMKKHKKKSTRK
ncbi:MAG: tetratricopeptide repeat protein [Bacteroidetes bacterium]|nr:tetratricopeptide repeat protein [Bacteroidota bacterium]